MMLVDLPRSPQNQQFQTPAQKRFYEITARAHNTICVAERDHQIDAQGSILESKSTKNYRWIACDAGGACGDGTQFIRHVVMIVDPETNDGHTVIVLDELTNGAPETFEQLWHTRGRVELDEATQIGTITGIRNQLHFALAATVESSVKLKSARIDSHCSERFLHITGGALGQVLLATVLGTGPIKGNVEIQASDEGVTVLAGSASVQFKPTALHLKLSNINA